MVEDATMNYYFLKQNFTRTLARTHLHDCEISKSLDKEVSENMQKKNWRNAKKIKELS
jgi:hypothetical protein